MTEQKWESTVSPWPLRNHVADLGLLTLRKKALFAVACCRRIIHLIRDERSICAIEVCEAHADGEADFDTFCEVSAKAFAAARDVERNGNPGEEQLAAHAAKWLSPDDTKLGRAAEFAGEAIGFQALSRADLIPADTPLNEALAYWDHPTFMSAMAAEERVQADLIRDLFGNPFRPFDFRDDWRTSTVLALTCRILQEQDYSLFLILADALEDAGCEDADILNHCRGTGPHVRGCWVVDLVLGKS
jgi:hypothetical protein